MGTGARGAAWAPRLTAPSRRALLPPCPLVDPYRDELKRHYNLGEYWVEVEMEDLASFDEELADYLYKQPAEHLQLVSSARFRVLYSLALSRHQQLIPFLFFSLRKLPRR